MKIKKNVTRFQIKNCCTTSEKNSIIILYDINIGNTK